MMPSVVTLFQSHSSSSATSCARPVSVPCPISERAMRITQVSSGLIATQMLTSARGAPAPAPSRTPNGTLESERQAAAGNGCRADDELAAREFRALRQDRTFHGYPPEALSGGARVGMPDARPRRMR